MSEANARRVRVESMDTFREPCDPHPSLSQWERDGFVSLPLEIYICVFVKNRRYSKRVGIC
jgi:hypothetical protein